MIKAHAFIASEANSSDACPVGQPSEGGVCRTRRAGTDEQLRCWVTDPRNGSDEIALLVALSTFADFDTGIAWPSGATLRELLGRDEESWSKKRLQAAIERASANGHLVTKQRRSSAGRNGGLEFQLVGPRYHAGAKPEVTGPGNRFGTLDRHQGSESLSARVPERNPRTESPELRISHSTAQPRAETNCRKEPAAQPPEASVVTFVTRDWRPRSETVELVEEQLPELDQERFLRTFLVQHVGRGLADPDAMYRKWAASERRCRKSRNRAAQGMASGGRGDTGGASSADPERAGGPPPKHPKLERMVMSQNHISRLGYAARLVEMCPRTGDPISERNALARDIRQLVDRMVESGEWPAG